MINKPLNIIIHCTDYSYRILKDQFIACNQWHKDRYFTLSSLGYYGGYHRIITGGKNYQYRLDTDEGCHCNQQENGVSMNFQSLGICIGFDGDVELPTIEDYKLLQEQVWKWQDIYNIPSTKVYFHRHYSKEKTCPGSLITDQWLKDLLTRPLPLPDVMPIPSVHNSCTDDIVKKASAWDNLMSFIKSFNAKTQ